MGFFFKFEKGSRGQLGLSGGRPAERAALLVRPSLDARGAPPVLPPPQISGRCGGSFGGRNCPAKVVLPPSSKYLKFIHKDCEEPGISTRHPPRALSDGPHLLLRPPHPPPFSYLRLSRRLPLSRRIQHHRQRAVPTNHPLLHRAGQYSTGRY